MKIKVTENLKNFIGDITGLNVRVPSYYRTESDSKWNDIHVVLKDNTLVVGGGGVDAIMFHKVPTEGQVENFSFSVDRKRFFEATKFFGKEFMIENEDDQFLRLSKSSKAVRLIPSSPHPVIESLVSKSFEYFGKESEKRLRIKKEDFNRARQYTSEDRMREALLNVCIRDGFMNATDGHALCSIRLETDITDDILITQYSPINFDYDAFIHKIKGYHIFSNDDTVIFQNKIAKEYPNLQKIIDNLDGAPIRFKRKDLLYTLRFLSGIGHGGADIKIKEDKATIKFADMYDHGIFDQAGDVLKIVNKKNIEDTLRFNLKYIIKVIRSLEIETIDFYIPETYGSPCYIKEKGNIYIIMPMAIN